MEIHSCVSYQKISQYLKKFVNVDQVIVQNMPSVEAHNALWDYWNENRSKYDLLVKVDADMVLIDDTVIYRVLEAMHKNSGDAFQLRLKDYFFAFLSVF